MIHLSYLLALVFTTVAVADVAPLAQEAKNASGDLDNTSNGDLQKAVDDLSSRSNSNTEIAAMVQKFLHQADDDASENDILKTIQTAKDAEKTSLRTLRSDAKKAARLFKTTARKAEQVSKRAGVPERIYEKAYQEAEQKSEHMEEQAESLAEKGGKHAEDLFNSVQEEVKKAFKTKEKAKKDSKTKEKAKEKAEKKDKQNNAAPSPPSPPATPLPQVHRKPWLAKPLPEAPEEGSAQKAEADKEITIHKKPWLQKAQTLAALPGWSTHAFALLAWTAGTLATVVAVQPYFRRPEPMISTYPLLG